MATRGEMGQIANSEIKPTVPIGVWREQELKQACEHYGVTQLHFLGYMDGQTTIASQSEAVYRLVKLMRQIKPQVVLTFGPDGVYGHYDHLAVHRWVTAAVELAADAERWPDVGEPHTVAKFYHRAPSEEQRRGMKEQFGYDAVFMDGIPFPFVGYPWEQITTVIDIEDVVETKIKAIRCHASQFPPDWPFFQEGFDWKAHNPNFGTETFILARSDPKITINCPDGAKEDDFFNGLR